MPGYRTLRPSQGHFRREPVEWDLCSTYQAYQNTRGRRECRRRSSFHADILDDLKGPVSTDALQGKQISTNPLLEAQHRKRPNVLL